LVESIAQFTIEIIDHFGSFCQIELDLDDEVVVRRVIQPDGFAAARQRPAFIAIQLLQQRGDVGLVIGAARARCNAA
jgi:hypothetical protein